MKKNSHPVSVFKLIYALVIILALILFSNIWFVIMLSEQEDIKRDKLDGYHQYSILEALRLEEAINEARLELHDHGYEDIIGAGNEYYKLADKNVLMLLNRHIVEGLSAITSNQSVFDDTRFEFLVNRLEDKVKDFSDKIALVPASGHAANPIYETTLEDILIASHQFRGLHQYHLQTLKKEIVVLDNDLIKVVSLMGMLSIVLAIFVFYYMMRFIRKSLEERDAASEKSIESNKRARLIMDSSGEAIFGLDLQGDCIFMNPVGAQVLGYVSVEDALGKNMQQEIHHTGLDGTAYSAEDSCIFKAGISGQDVFTNQDVFWRKNGSSFPVEYIAHPILEQDEVTGLVVTFVDISDRLYNEQQIKQSQENMQALADNIGEGLIINQGGVAVYANKAISRMLGYKNGSLVGATIGDVAHPDCVEDLENRYISRMQGQPLENKYDTVFLDKDGSSRQVELSVSETTWKGRPAATIIVRDLTERQRILIALQNERDMSQAILDSAKALIVVMDKEGRIEHFNQMCEQVSLYAYEEVKGRYAWDVLFDAEQRDNIIAIFDVMIAGESKDRYKLWITTKSNEKRLIEWSSGVISTGGEALKLAAIGIDITEKQQIEDLLNRSERSLLKAQEISNIGNWVWDITSNTIEWSDQIYRIFGVENNHLAVTYDDFHKSVHPDDRENVEEAVLNCVADASYVYNIGHRIIRPDGEVRFVRELGEVIRDAEGSAIQMIGTVQDRTEQVLANDKLYRQGLIIDQIRDSVIVTDLKGIITNWNQGAERMFGYAADEMIGETIKLTYPDNIDRDSTINNIIDVVRKDGMCEIEVIRRRKDGQLFNAQISLSMQYDDSGEAMGIIGYTRDITDRINAESQLIKEKDRAQTYLDIVGTILIALDDQGIVTLINRKGCETLQCSEDDVVGKNWFDNYIPESIRDDVKGTYSLLIEGEADPVASYQNPILLPGGEERIIFWKNSVLYDDEGDAIGTLSAGEDVTDRIISGDNLRKSLAEKEVLLRELHHRVKNILQIISSLINMQSRQIKDEKAREAFVETRDRIRAVALIYEKLFGESNLSEIDVKKYIEYIAGRLDPVYEASLKGIKTEISGDTIILNMEKALPCGLIANELLTNIYKHAFSDGSSGYARIVLSNDGESGYSITVSDDGIGIENKEKSDSSFGMDIMSTLTRQIGGDFNISGKKGTTARLTFSK